eukprot:CAMPEP_0184667022 /NCGR_PEP_ID=MMETSP0308-20130426/65071_1 /TAXON_ID=38269 /ORGANISM="Gloeochaete witrockiana, Strain SAG 46.84" /LENGTH=422 /DNA_ID=CAMNT_0027111971 /DNA_START=20 /DNA_END=1284 /DNA_ORIENTATION=+
MAHLRPEPQQGNSNACSAMPAFATELITFQRKRENSASSFLGEQRFNGNVCGHSVSLAQIAGAGVRRRTVLVFPVRRDWMVCRRSFFGGGRRDWAVPTMLIERRQHLYLGDHVWECTVAEHRTKPLQLDPSQLDMKNKKQLGQGGFGSVFRGKILHGPEAGVEVVVKCLNNEPRTFQQGDVELYANTKLMHMTGDHIAPFLGYYKTEKDFWLIWKYEGDNTVDCVFQKKDWLPALEMSLWGRTYGHLEEAQRKSHAMKETMTQVFKGLYAVHSNNIVHRDIKPANLIITDSRLIKVIDFGCAVDLGTNVGYIPKEAPGTREYLPPEWRIRLDHPTAFDMFAAGMIMLQIAFPNVRSTESLDRFRAELRSMGGDLDKWLQRKLRGETLEQYKEGLAALNFEDGAGWDLLRGLMQNDPAKRITA